MEASKALVLTYLKDFQIFNQITRKFVSGEKLAQTISFIKRLFKNLFKTIGGKTSLSANCFITAHCYVEPGLHMVVTIAEHASDVAPKRILTLSGPAFSVVRQARGGGSEAQMPKIKVNINQLK